MSDLKLNCCYIAVICLLKLLGLRSADYSISTALIPENKTKNRNLMYIPCKIDY